jgi:hypothetical protein
VLLAPMRDRRAHLGRPHLLPRPTVTRRRHPLNPVSHRALTRRAGAQSRSADALRAKV